MTDHHDTFGDLEESFDKESPAPEEDSSTPDSIPEQQSETTSNLGADRSNGVDEPAFAFSETDQKALYARSETWEIWDDALFDVEGVLRKQDVRDVPKRELHDAALRVLSEFPEQIAEQLLTQRQKSGESSGRRL